MTWCVVALFGAAAGSWSARDVGAPSAGAGPTPQAAWRAAALAPALLALPGGAPMRALTWAAVGGAAFHAGRTDAHERQARACATASDPWSPSGRVRHAGAAAMRVTAWPRQTAAGQWRAPAVVLAWLGDGVAAGQAVLLRGEGPAPHLWQIVAGRCEAEVPRPATVPGGFDEARYLAGRGIAWRMRATRGAPLSLVPAADGPARCGAALARVLSRFEAVLATGMPAREAGLARAVLLNGGTDPALRDPFVRLGLAHLFALSGLHVGLVAGVVLAALRLAVRGPVGRWALLTPVLVVYAVLVSLPGSVVRATGLTIGTLAAPVAGRQADGLRLLGLLLWANLVWEPAASLDTGVRLSYLAAGGIVMGNRLVTPWTAGLARPWRWLASAATVTFAAQTATMIEVAGAFGRLNLLAPLANLVAVPVFGVAASLAAGGLALGVAWPWGAQGPLALATVLLRLLATGAARGAPAAAFADVGLPGFGPGRVALYVLLAALLALALTGGPVRPRWARGAAAVALLGALTATAVVDTLPPRGGALAVQFDIGQGDCAAVRLPDGWTALIDTGDAWPGGAPVARDVVPWLRRRGTRALDAVVLTHGHADHTGGARWLADAMPVRSWYLGGAATPPAAIAAPRCVRPVAGDTLHAAGGWALVCHLPARAAPAPANENDASLAVGLWHDTALVALWTGDLESPGERRLLDLPPRSAGPVDYWKAGHHGSSTSGTQALLDLVRPRLIGISCGLENRHRHPSHGPYVAASETLTTGRTDLEGSVLLRWPQAGSGEWAMMGGRRGTWASMAAAVVPRNLDTPRRRP